MNNVPYSDYEAKMTRMEKTQKHLLLAILTAVGMLAGSNLIWLLICG